MKNRLEKKAQMGTVVKMILIIASAIILIIAITTVLSLFIAKGDVEACRLSVLAQANTKLIPNPTGDKSPFNIKCDKHYINFYNNRVEAGYDPGKTKPIDIQYSGRKTKNIPQLDDYVVNQVLSEELRKCWYQFGEGKVDVFDTDMIQGAGSFFGANDVCFICTEATIDDNTQQGEFNGLIDYLKTTNIQKQGITYFEYFNNQPSNKINWSIYTQMLKSEYFTFYREKKYMVVFLKEDRRISEAISEHFSKFYIFSLTPPAIVYSAIKSVFTNDKAKENNYFVMVIPDTELNNFCDLQAA